MYIRSKSIKGHMYFYLVRSERHGKKVTQKFLGYLGTGGGRMGAVSTERAGQKRTATGLEALAQVACKYKSAETFVKNMREGVVLEYKSLPDILRAPMTQLVEARRSGTFLDIQTAKQLVEKNADFLNRKLKGKPYAPLYRLSDTGKIIFTASDITTLPQGLYEPAIFNKKVSAIKPREAKELISKIEEQVRQRAIDPLVGADKIQLLQELKSRQTLTGFYNQVRQKMIG